MQWEKKKNLQKYGNFKIDVWRKASSSILILMIFRDLLCKNAMQPICVSVVLHGMWLLNDLQCGLAHTEGNIQIESIPIANLPI